MIKIQHLNTPVQIKTTASSCVCRMMIVVFEYWQHKQWLLQYSTTKQSHRQNVSKHASYFGHHIISYSVVCHGLLTVQQTPVLQGVWLHHTPHYTVRYYPILHILWHTTLHHIASHTLLDTIDFRSCKQSSITVDLCQTIAITQTRTRTVHQTINQALMSIHAIHVVSVCTNKIHALAAT